MVAMAIPGYFTYRATQLCSLIGGRGISSRNHDLLVGADLIHDDCVSRYPSSDPL